MKKREKSPDDKPVYYYKKDPFNIITKSKALTNGILRQYRSQSSFIRYDKSKPPLSKQKDNNTTSSRINNNNNTNVLIRSQSLFNNMRFANSIYSISRYTMNLMEKQKNEKEFEDKINFLYSQIEIKPIVKRMLYDNSNKVFNIKKSWIDRPIEMQLRLEKSYQRIPHIYKAKGSKYNHNPYHKSFDHNDEEDYIRNRYEKPKINIEEVIRNYNANAKKWFSCEKIKMYHIKVSPFLSRIKNKY